ncbi:CDP-glycerol glycerophosphotransferase family protein [Aliidiomarina celeris]|uniref:CDP-glycerol glycerophosphotransferase family protein n=1 Tax=Aliidiomarina celeris TaxID=2249428 RepID=UPI000DEB2471|nr:CDP-glycerol glycerophosphotransferase family protein [Aliidiomarina celeris]
MHVTELNGGCYVAPANPAGRKLLADIKLNGVTVLGLIDNLKQAEDIVEPPKRLPPSDIIIVARGDAQERVCDGLIARGFPRNQIYLQQSDLFIVPMKKKSILLRRFRDCLLRYFITISRLITPKGGVVYYSENFVDCNILLTYRRHLKLEPKQPVLVCRRLQRQSVLLESNDVIKSLWGTWWFLSRARVIVIDHEYTGTFFSLIRSHCKVVQLWHGLPYKHISGNKHYLKKPDDSFISSSEWYNREFFSSCFSAKQFFSMGYSRNDAFLQIDSDIDWCNCPSRADLEKVISKTGPLWFYMPTYREGQITLEQLDLERLNALCIQLGKSFVLKLHPFISRQLESMTSLNESDNEVLPLSGFEHIYLFPSGMNVYPWLAKSKALITDYSSVVSDYLLHDHPIIFYQYDSSDYSKIRGQSVVDEAHFICGPVAYDFTELCGVLRQLDEQHDSWRAERERLKGRLQLTEKPATTTIAQYISALAKKE